jgi:hypothetical protein
LAHFLGKISSFYAIFMNWVILLTEVLKGSFFSQFFIILLLFFILISKMTIFNDPDDYFIDLLEIIQKLPIIITLGQIIFT